MTIADRFAFTTNGRAVHIRAIREDDGDLLVALHASLSVETKYRRFFGIHPTLPDDEIYRFTHVDGSDRVALVVLDGHAIVAVGRYDRSPDRHDSADVAFVVTDAWQGESLGSLLLEGLTKVARRHGISRFTADTLTTNAEMMRLFRRAGFALSMSYDYGVIHVEFPIAVTDESVRQIERRRRRARQRYSGSTTRPALAPVHLA